MTAPMILPWLAHRWGVRDARALELWHQACRDAETVESDCSSSRYWDLAKGRLIDLLDNEVLAQHTALETPQIMMQLNFWRLLARVKYWVGQLEQRCSTGSPVSLT